MAIMGTTRGSNSISKIKSRGTAAQIQLLNYYEMTYGLISSNPTSNHVTLGRIATFANFCEPLRNLSWLMQINK